MNKRAGYLLQILEKIGTPLMAAITDVAEGEGADASAKQAHMMATMLGKTVQASIDLGQMIEVDPADAGDDSLRVALAGLAAPLVAGQLAKKRAVPDEADIKKITGALQAVLTFSDNFMPTDGNAARLQTLEAYGQSVDLNQAHIQYVRAFVPVVQAISKFAFGQNEQKLVVDVTRVLSERAVQMRQKLMADLQGDEAKRADLSMLSSCARLYAQAHEAEIAKAAGMADNPAAQPSQDSVWKAFDLQASMLEIMAQSMVPGMAAQSASSHSGDGVAPEQGVMAEPIEQPTPPPPSPPPPPPMQAPQEQVQSAAPAGANPMGMFAKKPDTGAAAPAAPPIQQTPPPQQTQPPAGQQTGGNPMAMFASKPPEQAAVPPQQPSSPVAPPPPQEQPQQMQAPQAQDQGAANPLGMFAKKPEAAAPQTPPPQTGSENAGDETQEGSGGGGSPMSFFKQGG